MGVLTGRAVLITGAGRGLGAEYARAVIAGGGDVVVNDVDPDQAELVATQLRAAGGRAVACPGDVSVWDEAQRMVSTCVCEFGSIDGLVNNAGVQLVGPPAAMDPDRIRRLLEINVLGAVYCGTLAMAAMVAAGRGSIVNVSSGAHMGLRNYSIYGASKGAISSLTYCWALDLTGTGVRVNTVSPRAATAMAVELVESLPISDAERRTRLAEFPSAASNAPVVVYLLSELSVALTGQTVRIDGERLSVVAKPAIQEPELIDDAWDPERIATAFTGALAPALMPPGLVRVAGRASYRSGKNEA